jgi:photosystem II stability/assembly factor-like uncharacterized protein
MMGISSPQRSTFVRYLLMGCLLWVAVISCGEESPTNSDGQSKWIPGNTGLENLFVQFLAVHPVNTDIVFAGTFDGLYRSTDGAESWTRVDSGWTYTQISAVAFDPLAGEIVYAGTRGDGVYRSEDGGDHWERKIDGLSDLIVWGLATDPSHPDTVFAGVDGGICRSQDGVDSSWTKVYYYQRAFIAIDPQNSMNIYAGGKFNALHRSLEGGDNGTWEESSTGIVLGGPQCQIQWIAIDPQNPSVLYAASNSKGLYKSTNRGESWERMDAGIGSNDIRSVVIDPSDTDVLYAATEKGIYRSLDGAVSWKRMNDGLPNSDSDSGPDCRVVVIDSLHPDLLYAGVWGEGVFVWR